MDALIKENGKTRFMTEAEVEKATGMTQVEYALHREVTKQAVNNKYIKAGLLTRENGGILENGNIDVEVADGILDDVLDPGRTKDGKDLPGAQNRLNVEPGKGAFSEARASKEFIQCEILRLELEKKTGKLTLVSDVDKGAFVIGRLVRDRMLLIADRVSSLLLAKFGIEASEENQREGYELLLCEIEKAIEGVC